MHKWLELFDYKLNVNILKTVELFLGVSMIQLELPFADVDDLISQIAKFNMAVIFSEIIDALLGEYRFNEIVAITDQNSRNDLNDEKSHRLLEGSWKLLHHVGRPLSEVFQLSIHVTELVQVIMDDTLELRPFEIMAHF